MDVCLWDHVTILQTTKNITVHLMKAHINPTFTLRSVGVNGTI